MTDYLVTFVNLASIAWLAYMMFILVMYIFHKQTRLAIQIHGFAWWVPVSTVAALIWLLTYNFVG